ncbi:MAG TPA: hypothetical protein VM737_11555 [Gemmatimonadota bacterium]|nr:hypothetical protein [Gemmatimonadota bacterium]
MRSKIGAGVVAGLFAGLVYGIVMQMVTTPMPGGGGMPMAGGRMPMMAMVAQVVRSDSLAVGWIFLLIMGMVMGGIFGWVLAGRAARIGGGLAWGALYGVFWWVLGTLILMPILLGMSAFAPLTMAPMRPGAMWSLAAYLLCGPILGAIFVRLYRGEPAAPGPVPRA